MILTSWRVRSGVLFVITKFFSGEIEKSASSREIWVCDNLSNAFEMLATEILGNSCWAAYRDCESWWYFFMMMTSFHSIWYWLKEVSNCGREIFWRAALLIWSESGAQQWLIQHRNNTRSFLLKVDGRAGSQRNIQLYDLCQVDRITNIFMNRELFLHAVGKKSALPAAEYTLLFRIFNGLQVFFSPLNLLSTFHTEVYVCESGEFQKL